MTSNSFLKEVKTLHSPGGLKIIPNHRKIILFIKELEYFFLTVFFYKCIKIFKIKKMLKDSKKLVND